MAGSPTLAASPLRCPRWGRNSPWACARISLPSQAGGAITDREHVVVARRLQRWTHDELVDAIGLQPIELVQEFRRLHPRRPDDELGRNELAARETDAVLQHLGDAGRRADADLHFGQELLGLRCDARRQCRQHAVGRFDQDQTHVLVDVDAVEAVRHQRPRRVVQLRRELDAGGAGADDRDMQLLGPQRLGLGVGTNVGVDETPMKPRGLRRIVEGNREFARARRAEVVGPAADGDDQRVVWHRPRWTHQIAVGIDERRDLDLAARAVEAGHAADAIDESVPVGLGEVVGFVDANVHAACGELVQVRLPEVRARGLDQRDVRQLAATERIAEPGRELEAAGAAADDDDAVRHGVTASSASLSRVPDARTREA